MMGLHVNDQEGAGGVTFGGGEVLKRPDLAMKIADVGACWSLLEAHAGQLLGVLMQAEPASAIALLGRFTTASAKSQTIEVVAKATLLEPQVAELKELLKRFNRTGDLRNKIAHGMWGTDPRRPEELVWAPPSVIPFFSLSIVDHMLAGKSPDDIIAEQATKFEFYDAARLDQVVASIRELTEDLLMFMTPLLMASVMKRHPSSVQFEYPSED